MGQIKTWHVNNLSSRYAVLPLLLLCNVIVCGFSGDKSPRKYNSHSAQRKIWRGWFTLARMPVYHTSTHTHTHAHTGGGKKIIFIGFGISMGMLILPFVRSWLSILKGYPHALIRPPIFVFSVFFCRFTINLLELNTHISYIFLQNVCPSKSSSKIEPQKRKKETRTQQKR